MQSLSPGTILSSYAIIRLIGRGGMGEVYEANEQTLDRRVALKVIAREKIGSSREADIIRRFLQEARILAQVNHPNVVTIHAIDRYLETQFIAMEYIEGVPFHELFAFLAFSSSEAAPMFMQVLEGMQAMHSKNILHRDLKPHNLMLRTDGQLKILDFGIAKRQGDNDPAEVQKKLVGTLAYMAPEVVSGSRADQRSDMWSLGAIFYEALVGHSLVTAGNEKRVGLRARPNSDIVFPIECVSRVAPAIREIIARLCDRNPQVRYANLGEAIADMKRFIHANPPSPDFAKSLCKIVEGFDLIKSGFDRKRVNNPEDKRAFTIGLLKEVTATFDAESATISPADPSEIVSITSDSIQSRQKTRKRVKRNRRTRVWPAVAAVNTLALVGVVAFFGLKGFFRQMEAADSTAAVRNETVQPPLNLLSPASGQAVWMKPGDLPLFTWSRPVSGDTSLQVAADSEFKKILLTANVEGSSYRPAQSMPDGAYYWRLNRANGSVAAGPVMFSMNALAPLDLLKPEPGSRLALLAGEKLFSAEFAWICKPGANSYFLQLSRTAEFTRIVKEGVLTSCAENRVSLPAGRFFWRVRVESPQLENSPWSTVANFTVQSKGVRIQLPTAAAVKPWPSKGTAVARRVAVEKPVTSISPPKSTYLESPQPSDMKQTFTIKFKAQDLDRDLASVRAQMSVPQLSWNLITEAKSYRVEISKTPDFTQIIHRSTTNANHLEWSGVMPGRFFWRVTALGATSSHPSIGAQLDIKLPPPTLMSTYSNSPRGFEWETIPLAERYIVEWDRTRSLSEKTQKVTRKAQIYLDMSAGPVFVRVATANARGERTSEFSRIARVLPATP